MADYYSILKKTIASLPENNGAARRSVYSRARNAIVNQLKAYEPPLSPSEITSEQLRLEEAIRKVEAEAARESLGLTSKAKAPPSTEPAATPAPQAPTPTAKATDPVGSAPETPSAPQNKPTEPVRTEPVLPEPSTSSPLKDVVEEAENLGEASHKAVQDTKDAMVGDRPSERLEPLFGASEETHDALDDTGLDEGASADAVAPAIADKTERAKSRRKPRERKSASAALKGDGKSSILPMALVGVLVIIAIGIAAVLYSQRDMVSGIVAGSDPVVTEEPVEAAVDDSQPTETTAPTETETSVETDVASKNEDRLLDEDGEPAAAPDARSVTTTLITPGEDSVPRSTPSEAETPDAPETAEVPEVTPEEPIVPPTVTSEDRVPSIVSTPPADATPGVQKSILYEEGENSNGAGTASQGEVVWSVDEETDLEGNAQSVLSAVVRIPERNVAVDIRIKPNDDASLPASHLVEIKYDFPETFSAGDVVNVPGLVMKPTEEARGDALIGASVKVSPGYFWIALSSISSEMERNMGLLRERGWIDIPMLYDNGKRGILTLEKGEAGSSAVEQAIAAWQAG
ncbi:hypothetical protein [Roseibium polysiphoniae]|uniref:CheA signal transduction histidine kinase n=1 Tax=Roseibium polysiphoniae TaxID=2571221 RepID=A0ABR9CAF4_9HYPH|nr:hypothetical protein [Roseibium polysiphoniae]MBD8876884.1 hypothetical protein [Roseibium polysiphoniae]